MNKLTESQLVEHSAHLFSKQRPMVTLYQTLAQNFYPERADFTTQRNVGNELADDLIDSYPILVRRDMGNALSAMLRDGEWVEITIGGEPDYDGRGWLQWATQRLRKQFNDRSTNFTRATKEGDHDYITFGQCVISVEMNKLRTGLLFRCWHLRDCAWFEDETGQVCGVHRKWKPTYYQLVTQFGKEKLSTAITSQVDAHPHKEADILHLVMPAPMYGDEKIASRFKYASIFFDVANKHIIEEVGLNHSMYVIPRFQTIAGSQYAYSPATVVGLPDARLLQAMTHTLLEAGERYVRPPLIATSTVVRSDVDLSPDGITWVDKEYDERLGAALRPIAQDRGGYPIGLELRTDIKETLASAFYLNKITLPPVDTKTMTAYEVSERMKQYRREALPLFAPIEADYNGQLCEMSFDLMMTNGLLGSPYDIPQSLSGRDVVFKFKSPLSAADEEKKANRFQQVATMLADVAQLDPSLQDNVDLDQAFRDAVEGIGSPNAWLHDPKQVETNRAARAQKQMATAAATAMGGKDAGAAVQQLPQQALTQMAQ